MREPDPQELSHLDAADAARRHFDARNYRRSRFVWVVLVLISFASLVAGLEAGAPFRILAGGASLIALLAALLLRRTEAFRANFPIVLFALVSLEILLWMLAASEGGLAIALAVVVVGPTLLLLRLRAVEQATIAAVTVGAAYLRVLVEGAGDGQNDPLTLGGVLAVAIVVSIAAVIGSSLTVRQRQEFLARWRQAAARERDRLRMREELHDARAVQLAMLPSGSPRVEGLDVAGVCVPATEVGGDYFDYFTEAPRALGVAIGDVAGHGMASGLVLAGVRAGLHLLADELAADPARLLARLNGIVGAPGGQRLLMTLGLARFDRARGRATWVSAGHPPPLRYEAAAGACESPETGHPPLGTRLPIRLEVVERPLAEGDVWLLVSDGALEARDGREREFGDSVLARSFRRLAAAGEDAGTIVDGLLAELSRFRAGAPQEDDLTLVVVRATPL